MKTETAQHTPGPWDFAADSYGRVQHSKKACVYATVKSENGERLVNIAQRIENWEDARLIASAPELLEALREAQAWFNKEADDPAMYRKFREVWESVGRAIAKAEGR